MKHLQTIHDYKTLAMPLDMIAKKNNVSLHRAIHIIYNAMTVAPHITESKKILKEIESL